MKTSWIAATLGLLLTPLVVLPIASDRLPKRQPDTTVFNPYEIAVQRHGIPVVR